MRAFACPFYGALSLDGHYHAWGSRDSRVQITIMSWPVDQNSV